MTAVLLQNCLWRKLIGAAKADVARMDALEELQGREVVVNLLH